VIRWLFRWLWRLVLLVSLVVIGWVWAYAFANPPTTLLIEAERHRLGHVERQWRNLDAISPHLARAVVAAEDADFCAHGGFDFDAIRQALEERERGRFRGASTITQQVAKNAFLWPAPTWTRKALEAGLTVLIEAFWSKRRIVEIYLNIAEMGDGVFGAEAAAQHWFGKPAAALTLAESARIAAILPAPRSRSATRPGASTERRARAIADGARTIAADGRDRCLGLG
jgi:monofunctional biosynthetic peptidoglycan transglycosylase